MYQAFMAEFSYHGNTMYQAFMTDFSYHGSTIYYSAYTFLVLPRKEKRKEKDKKGQRRKKVFLQADRKSYHH